MKVPNHGYVIFVKTKKHHQPSLHDSTFDSDSSASCLRFFPEPNGRLPQSSSRSFWSASWGDAVAFTATSPSSLISNPHAHEVVQK